MEEKLSSLEFLQLSIIPYSVKVLQKEDLNVGLFSISLIDPIVAFLSPLVTF